MRSRSEAASERSDESSAKPAGKKKKKAARRMSEKAARQKVEDLVESAQPKLTELPRPTKTFSAIVEKVFALEDPVATYDELEEALDQRGEALTPGVLRELLADSPRLYREAHRLYITARTDFERFEIQLDAFESAMRDDARRELESDKDMGLRSKAPTIKDIEDRVQTMFPAAYADLRERRVMARKTTEDLNHLVDVFKARGFALKALVGGKEEL